MTTLARGSAVALLALSACSSSSGSAVADGGAGQDAGMGASRSTSSRHEGSSREASGRSTPSRASRDGSASSGSRSTGESGSSTGGASRASSSAPPPVPDAPASLADYALVFDDELDALSLRPTGDCNWGSSPAGMCTGAGTWLPEYTWDNRTLSSNSEAEIYVDPTYAGSGAGCTGPLGIDPFSVSSGILTIAANPTPAADLGCLMNLPYTSGAIVSYPSFSTTYGFFETRAKLPAGQGLWPAFWLLDENLQWPPEIDIFEFIGGQYTTLEMHTHDSNASQAFGGTATVPDVSLDFHVYGLDWEADTITWYFDGVQQAQTATASDLNQPMYILLNLAVGGAGSWPGPPNAATAFPAEMQVDYVRVWKKP